MSLKTLLILNLSAIFLGGCETYSHGYHATPGHIMQDTGYNPASGKWHPEKGEGKGKGKKRGW